MAWHINLIVALFRQTSLIKSLWKHNRTFNEVRADVFNLSHLISDKLHTGLASVIWLQHKILFCSFPFSRHMLVLIFGDDFPPLVLQWHYPACLWVLLSYSSALQSLNSICWACCKHIKRACPCVCRMLIEETSALLVFWEALYSHTHKNTLINIRMEVL